MFVNHDALNHHNHNNRNANNTNPTKKSSTTLICVAMATMMTGCATTASQAQVSTIQNYGENLSALKTAYQQGDVHILQIGDSHTAGDYFTEQLRKRLQAEIGDGGVGFAYPAKLKGQRNARHGYQSHWVTKNSRSDKWGGDYPLGGVYASPSSRYQKLTLTSQYYAGDTQNADMVVYGQAGQTLTLSNSYGTRDVTLSNTGWQTIPSPIRFPTSIQADANVKLGGFWLKRNHGGIVSAMGINGATQDYWNRWQTDLSQGLSFSQADLVILAYGTNEAFRKNADLTSDMNKAIAGVRRGLPNAAILVVGAPESLKSTSGRCGTRSPSLDAVQWQLQQVAEQNRTLYWSWQDAMGGSCSMKGWVNQGLAARDGVHFSRAGYNHAANDLYDNLKVMLNSHDPRSTHTGSSGSSYATPNYHSQANPPQNYGVQDNDGYANNAYENDNSHFTNSDLTNIEIKRTYREHTPTQSSTGQPIFTICSASEGCVK